MSKEFQNEHKELVQVKDINKLNNIKKIILDICNKFSKRRISEDLSKIHEYISIKELNEFRINVFNEINKKNLYQKLYKICEDRINFLCTTDLAVQKRINISFHITGDKTSIIDLHSDTLSGQSPFEIVQWIPLCNVERTNSMYFFNNLKTKKINKTLKNYETKGFEKILNDYLNEKDYLKINYGQVLLFSPTNWHGNSINKTLSSRVSLNLRYKPLFSPKHDFVSNEKGMGTFYKILNLSESSKIGLNYTLPKIK